MPVPGKQPQNPSDQPPPLRLAEDGDASGASAAPAQNPNDSSRASATPNETSRSGSSLDTMLGKIVVERGLMSPDELEQCSSQLRAKRDGGSIEWIVMRNRLSNIDAKNKRFMTQALNELSRPLVGGDAR
jgi:hypothetical protein